MRKWSKTIGICIGVLTACLFIFAAGLFRYVHTDHFRDMILKRINASITGNLTIARHDISFLQGGIVLENLTVKAPSGRRLATLDYLSAEIAWLPLLNRTLDIQSMTLKNPDIRIGIGQDGIIDIAEAFKASAEIEPVQTRKRSGSPLAVVVRDARVTGGHVHIVRDSDNLQLDLRQLTIQTRADLYKHTGEVRLQVADTVLMYGERQLSIQPLNLSVVLLENRPASVVLEAKTDFAGIALDGEVGQLFHDPDLNLSMAFDFSLSELAGLMTLPSEFSGKTKGVLSVRGNWRDPQADLSLAYSGGYLAGYPVEGLHAGLNLKDRQVLVHQLELLAGSGEISLAGNVNLQDVFPAGLVSSPIYPDKVGYTIEASLKHIDVNFLDKDIDGVKGFLNSDVTIKGQGIDFKKLSASGTIDAVLEKFFSEGMNHPTDLQIQASGKIETGIIDLSQMMMMAAKTRLNAHGTFDIPAGYIQGRLTVDTENIENPLSLFGVTGYSGACAVKSDISGSWRQPDIGIELTGKQWQFDRMRLGDVHLAARMDENGLLEITSLNLENQGTRAQGNGTIQLFEERFRLHETMPLKAGLAFINARPHDFSDNQAVNGSFEGEMQISGNIRSLQGSAVLNGKDVTYEKVFLGDVDTRLRFFNGGFQLDQFRLKNQSAAYSLTGGIQVFEPNSWHRMAEPVLDLALSGDAVSIANYVSGIKGNLYLDAYLEGPASCLLGQGYIRGGDLDLYGQPVQQLTLDIELKDNRLHISTLQAFVDPGGVVTGSGWIGFDRSFSLDLHSMDMQLNCIDKIREMEKVAGRMDFHVRGEGSLKDPSIYGDIHVKEVQINHEKMDDIRFRIDLVHNQLSIKGHQTFELNLDYHLLNRDFSIDLLFADTDVAPFLLATGTKDIGGRLSGKIVAEGNTASLEKSEALLDISKLSLTYRGEVFANTDSIQGNLRNRQLSVPEFQLKFLKSGLLMIKGAWNFDGYVELTADGSIPAKAALLSFKDVTDVDGDIRVHAEIKGSAAEPGLSGEIQLDDVGYMLPQTDTSFKGINGKIQLTSSRISVENLTGKLNSGIFQIKGDVTLENYRPGIFQLEVKADKIPIHVPETMDVLIDTDLVVAGRMENLSLEGNVIILEGVYYKNLKINLLQGMKEKRRTEDLPPKKTNHPLFDKITFDIQLKYREPFIVDNNIAHLEIHPDLVLSGTLGDPIITGIAKVNEGTITYQNKAFVVEKGIVNFVNPYKIEPEIDIMGNIRIRQWLIILAVSGTPDRLVVALSSLPSEDDADILSLLVFGKTTYEMRGADKGVVDSTEALLAQVMASSFGADIKKATGLDYLEVETKADEIESDSDAIQVTVGKDLTERMTVKYTIESGRSGYHQRAATEYKLIEYILLSGFQDIEGNYGGEIIFRVEFRMFQ